MASVPLVIDRLKAAVESQVAKSSLVVRVMFAVAFYLKRRNYLRGNASPLLDRLVFNKIKNKFGGRLRYMLCGGAPLSASSQEFLNICFCCPVMLGYGLSKTMGGGCITHPSDVKTGCVGLPVSCCEIRLEPEPEMGYTEENKSGEVWIRGGNVTLGYFEMPKETSESFIVTDDDPTHRWFRSGDIARLNDDGTFSIIDRKKDLVKLSHGEYIAVGNLESKYAHTKFVDNIAIAADSHHDRPIPLVVPNHDELKRLAEQAGCASHDVHALCADPKMKAAVLEELNKQAVACKLEKWERCAAVHLVSDEWTPQNGMLTEAMKLKRHEILKRHSADIEKLYKAQA